MNRVILQDGYAIPFNGIRRRRSSRRMSGAMKAQQNVMKACAKKWDGDGSYRSHMTSCLRAGAKKRK